jgi:hypothetical protein
VILTFDPFIFTSRPHGVNVNDALMRFLGYISNSISPFAFLTVKFFDGKTSTHRKESLHAGFRFGTSIHDRNGRSKGTSSRCWLSWHGQIRLNQRT